MGHAFLIERIDFTMKKLSIFLTCLALTAAMASCGSSDTSNADSKSSAPKAEESAVEETEPETEEVSEEETEPETEATTKKSKKKKEKTTEAATEEEEEYDGDDYDTGDPTLDNIRNEDEIGENEILVVSFGTSYNDSRRLTIGAIEDSIENAFPDYAVRRGFTSDIIIDHVKKRDKITIDSLDDALKRASDNKVKNLVIQPTHLMNGFEYEEIEEKIAQYSDAFDKVAIGLPLLTNDDDFKKVEEAIVDWTSDYNNDETAVVFMGHGTEADSNGVYQKMQDLLTEDGHKNYFIGTVEATPSLDDVIAKVKEGNYKKVVLEPLMVVAGDHANNDMAGDEDDSWKSAFEREGFEVECLLRGLGENDAIRQIYVDHAQEAINAINQ